MARKCRALDAGSGLFLFRRLEDESLPVFAAEPRGQCGVVDAQRFLREGRSRYVVELRRIRLGKRESGKS